MYGLVKDYLVEKGKELVDCSVEKGTEWVTDWLVETVEECSAIRSIEENMGILEDKIKDLSCRESDVQDELRTSKVLYGQKPRSEVEFWLKNVHRIKNEMLDIKQNDGDLGRFDVPKRRNLAKCIGEKIKEANELRAKGQFLNGLFINSLPSDGKQFPPVKLVGETTALKNKKMIEECLMDDEVGMIGVFGMGGVGKTTIVTQIYNNIKKANTFDKVIWVTVSGDSCLEKLQYGVSKELGLNLSSDDAMGRSAELFGAFNRMGRFLLILDDVWDAFPLEKIGIMEPDKENKCKIVWTTRSKKVCRGMGSHKPIEVKGLMEDESWTLFLEKLKANNMSPELEAIAKDVVKECDGLPLAIITVGAAMRGVDHIRTWRVALDDLRNSRTTEITEGMEDYVFTCLKFSFDKLRTQRLRDCFLYCALYPEDCLISYRCLIEHWMADELLDENEDLDKMLDMGYAIIEELKEACMLESDTFGRNFVKMHDLLRDLAINITRSSPKFVVKTSFRVNRISWDENMMTGADRVSFMSSNIVSLQCQPKSCPMLSTMLLSSSRLSDIHPLFFEHMHNLRVLDLSNTKIKCLPKSMSDLGKLRALWLCACSGLTEVPSLAKLKELRLLDLSETSIRCLPEGLEGLTNLRCLVLNYTRHLETFPSGIIPSLSCLEELCMTTCNWKCPSNGNEGEACVEEMLRLMHLRKLYVAFVDLNAFNCYGRSERWRDLKYFHLAIGNGHGGLSNRAVSISSINEDMSSLILPDNTLSLYIKDVTPMAEIPSTSSLKQLKTIHISSCPNLKYIFSVGWLRALQNLENVSISSCGREMEEMIVETEDMGESSKNNDNTITLPSLRYLALQDLQKLKSISNRIFICNSLEKIKVESCPKLKKLPFSINSLPHSLNSIRGSNEWWNSLEWDNSDTQSYLQCFFSGWMDTYSDDDDHGADVAADEEEEKRGTKRKADELN